MYDKKVNGYILRSKAIQIEGNEKNPTYFANLEKRRAEKKTIHKLIVDNIVLKDKDKILGAEANYYETLYTPESYSRNCTGIV